VHGSGEAAGVERAGAERRLQRVELVERAEGRGQLEAGRGTGQQRAVEVEDEQCAQRP
jgi:hypothetical protein